MIPRSDDWLYMIQCKTTGAVKVGRSNDPSARLAQLQTGCPTELHIWWQIQGGAFLERLFHELFADEKIRGEWYPKDSTAERTIRNWKLSPYRDTAGLLDTFARAVEVAATEGSSGRWILLDNLDEDGVRAVHRYAQERASEWDWRVSGVQIVFEERFSKKIDGTPIHKPSGETWRPTIVKNEEAASA